jgi:hypothetical protein
MEGRTHAMLKKVAPAPEGAHDRILRTAIAEFSEKGYSGARIAKTCCFLKRSSKTPVVARR